MKLWKRIIWRMIDIIIPNKYGYRLHRWEKKVGKEKEFIGILENPEVGEFVHNLMGVTIEKHNGEWGYWIYKIRETCTRCGITLETGETVDPNYVP